MGNTQVINKTDGADKKVGCHIIHTMSAEWNPQYPTTGSFSTWDVSTCPHSPIKRSFRATLYLAALDTDKEEIELLSLQTVSYGRAPELG